MTPQDMAARPAAQQWTEALSAWAIPAEILEAAVSFPYEMDPSLFRPASSEPAERDVAPAAPPSLATRRALEALPRDGKHSAIDVGCGGGAATMAIAHRLIAAIGVDQSPEMLALFSEEAQARDVQAQGIAGSWPDVAAEAGTADVVLCHHVAYNVADLGPFAQALGRAATRRVVMELTLTHPQTSNAPLWKQFWGLDRPDGPSAEDAHAVLVEAGIEATLEFGPAGALRRNAPMDARVATATRMLCLGPDRLSDVDAAVRALPPRSDQRAVIWWDAS